MSDMRISAGSTNLGNIVAAGTAAGGSPAQQAYQKAVKRLTEAQARLAQDAANREPDDTIKIDKVMVELAAAQVAQAAAALAREQTNAQRPEPPVRSAPAPAAAWWRDIHVEVDA